MPPASLFTGFLLGFLSMCTVSTCSRARLAFSLSIEFFVNARGDGGAEPVTAAMTLIADAPIDDFDEINVTVSGAELL